MNIEIAWNCCILMGRMECSWNFPGSVEQSAIGGVEPSACLLDLVHWLPCLTVCKLHTSKILRSSFNLHSLKYIRAALHLALHSAPHLLLHNRLGFGLLFSFSFLGFFFFYLEASSAAAQQRNTRFWTKVGVGMEHYSISFMPWPSNSAFCHLPCPEAM